MTTAGEHAATVYPLLASQMAEIVAQAETGYPEEICGIVIGKPGVPDTYQVRQVRNIANQDRQRDPAGFERDARTAYKMDGLEVAEVEREADARGWKIIGFYHSHPDHDAYFSEMDRKQALWNGEPFWRVDYHLVVSVRSGRAVDARYYIWDDARGDFAEVPASLPAV
jgi:proteasome lid subunit RPN8/RPN11